VTVTLIAKETSSVGETIVLQIFHLTQIAVNPLLAKIVMVKTMMESAVQLLHLVHTMKVTVTVTLNAKETLSVKTIVLNIFHLVQNAVKQVQV